MEHGRVRRSQHRILWGLQVRQSTRHACTKKLNNDQKLKTQKKSEAWVGGWRTMESEQDARVEEERGGYDGQEKIRLVVKMEGDNEGGR